MDNLTPNSLFALITLRAKGSMDLAELILDSRMTANEAFDLKDRGYMERVPTDHTKVRWTGKDPRDA